MTTHAQNIRDLSDSGDRLHSLLSDLADTGISHFIAWLQRPARMHSAAESFDLSGVAQEDVETDDGNDAAHAASLLDVDIDATADEIRAAFRRRVKIELGRGDFHDQAGTDTDTRAQGLIAAKNLLLDRNRSVHS